MASMFSWLRRVWSGSRNEPYRDYPPATYVYSHPPAQVPQTPLAKGATATTSELPVAPATNPNLEHAVQGIFNLHLNSNSNTFTSYPNISVDPVTPGHRSKVNIHLDTNNNTWVSDRPIYPNPIHESTPELGAAATHTSSRAVTSSSPTVQRHDYNDGSLRSPHPDSAVSVASGLELGGYPSDPRERTAASTGSYTERGDSPHRGHVWSPVSTHTLSPMTSSPALGNAASITGMSHREPFNTRQRERSISTISHMERDDSRRTHSRSASSTQPSSPAPEVEATGGFNHHQLYQHPGFNPNFSAPTPPQSSAVHYNRPFIKTEGSPSPSAPGPSRRIDRQPEMEQVSPTRTQPTAVANNFQTPFKAVWDIRASVQHPYTPPRTDSGRRQGTTAQFGENLETARPPPSPTTPTPSSRRTTNSHSTARAAAPITIAHSARTVAQPVTPPPASPVAAVNPTGRHPIRPSNSMEFTTLREIYAQPLANGYRILPTLGPSCLASGCHRRMTLQAPARSGPNSGRRYYTCSEHGWDFGTFADLEGRDDSRTCDCGEASRRTEKNKGGWFWKCMEMRCTWKRFV